MSQEVINLYSDSDDASDKYTSQIAIKKRKKDPRHDQQKVPLGVLVSHNECNNNDCCNDETLAKILQQQEEELNVCTRNQSSSFSSSGIEQRADPTNENQWDVLIRRMAVMNNNEGFPRLCQFHEENKTDFLSKNIATSGILSLLRRVLSISYQQDLRVEKSKEREVSCCYALTRATLYYTLRKMIIRAVDTATSK